MHNDEDVVRAQAEVTYLKEITRPDRRRLVAKKRRPALSSRRRAKTGEVSLNRAGGNGDTELEQLALNALGAPPAIVERHNADKRDYVLGQPGRARRLRLGAPRPQAAEHVAVPAKQ